jgi:Protein of unknown function (DUF3098)
VSGFGGYPLVFGGFSDYRILQAQSPIFTMATVPKKTAPSTARPAARTTSTPHQQTPLFGKENYRWMAIGLVAVALGLILMGGGKSKDPNVFNPKEIYSFTRITLAPILILGGFVIEIFAIFKKDKKESQ